MANPPDNNQLDTGAGGFVIDEPGIKNPGIYAYDVGSSSRPGDADYPIREVGRHGGNVNVDHSPKDISPATKTTLADYLGKKTAVNYYKVDGDAGYTATRISGENNTTPPIPAPRETTKNGKWFTQGKDNIGGVTPQSTNLSLRGWKTTPTSSDTPEGVLKEVISKGKEGGAIAGAYNGNDLLSKIDTPDPAAPADELPFVGKISKYQNAVLSNNRFAMTAERSKSFGSDSLVKKSSKKNVEGVSSTTDSAAGEQLTQYNPTFYHPKYGEITAGRLAQIGTALSLRASGEFRNAAASANDPSTNQTDWQANQFIASVINLNELDVDRVIRELSEEDLKDVFYTSISDNSSWGNITNVLNKYSGFSSTGLAALAIAMSAGVGSIISLFYNLILSNIVEKGDSSISERPRVPGSSRYALGSSKEENGIADSTFEFFKNLLGVIPTTYSYTTSVSKGNAIYFNLDEGQNQTEVIQPKEKSSIEYFNQGSKFKVTDNFLSVGAMNTILASGQIVAVSRAIIRSSIGIYDNFADVFVSGLGGGIGVERIKRLLSALESIGESKLMAALNMFATIGDVALSGEFYREQLESDRKETIPGDKNTVNIHYDRVGSFKLPWASNQAPSVYLVPNDIVQFLHKNVVSSDKLPRTKSADSATREKYLTPNSNQKNGEETKTAPVNRIPNELLASYEAELDAEYVPFYFHDIRTNEIVAFHAFLESLSDDYTVSYDSAEGIGRVEPVKLYKGTQRKIGMSFFLVSTSPEDFEDMWTKINKLTTLIYPQYTKGRYHEVGQGYKFIQPFSQLVGASPLIRIRLGNLFRSNYSKLALARLFGAELPDTKFLSDEKFNEFKNVQGVPNDADVGIEIADLRVEVAKERVRPGSIWYKQISGTEFFCEYVLNSISGDAVSATFNRIFKKNYSNNTEILVDEQTLKKEKNISRPVRRQIFSFLNKIQNKQNEVMKLSEHQRSAAKNENYVIQIAERLKKEKLDKLDEAAKDKYYNREYARLDSLKDFMSEEKNALVKSFKSANGKGLAGVIESMNFDWYSNVTWDVDMGKKAPKMCKVTISFSPMHDISPGLDSNGYNRAAIYPGNTNDVAPPPPPKPEPPATT